MDLDGSFFRSYLRLSVALQGYVPFVLIQKSYQIVSLSSRQDEKNLAICVLFKGKVRLAFKSLIWYQLTCSGTAWP